MLTFYNVLPILSNTLSLFTIFPLLKLNVMRIKTSINAINKAKFQLKLLLFTLLLTSAIYICFLKLICHASHE